MSMWSWKVETCHENCHFDPDTAENIISYEKLLGSWAAFFVVFLLMVICKVIFRPNLR